MCLKSVTETETNKPETNQTRVPATDRQEKTDEQIRIKTKPVMWKPDRVSAVLPDFSESLCKDTKPEKKKLSLSQKDMMIKPDINIPHENSIEGIYKPLDELNKEIKNVKALVNEVNINTAKMRNKNQQELLILQKKLDDLRNETKLLDSIISEKKKGKGDNKPYQIIIVENILSFGDVIIQNVDIKPRREMKSKPDASIKKLIQHLPERGGKFKQFDLNANAKDKIDRLEEITSPISNDPVNEKGADKVEGEESSPSISKEREPEQPFQSEKEANKGHHKKPNKLSVYLKKIPKKVKKIRQIVSMKIKEVIDKI